MKVVDLLEARRNPERSSRMRPLAILKQIYQDYNNANNLFVTFTNVPKFGINPTSSYKTPIGLYAYPLDYAIKVELEVPYASNANYIQLFEVKNLSEMWNFDDRDDTLAIIDSFKRNGITANIPNNLSTPALSKQAWRSIYNHISTTLYGTFYNDEIEEEPEQQGKASIIGTEARKVLKSLGIFGVIDNGHGIIHENEPVQAVFFDIRDLKLLQLIDNRNKQRWKHGEIIRKINTNDIDDLDPSSLYYAAMDTNKRLPKKAEEKLATNTLYAFNYTTHVLKKRLYTAEHLFATDPFYAYYYAKDIIKGEWPEGEKAIASSARYSFEYARNVIKGPFPEGEAVIHTNKTYRNEYEKFLKTL